VGRVEDDEEYEYQYEVNPAKQRGTLTTRAAGTSLTRRTASV